MDLLRWWWREGLDRDGRLFIGALIGASALVALLTCATIPLSFAMAGWTHP